MTESELSIEQIADKLQFSSASHFFQHFRQWTGLTPHKFRNQKVKENLPTANYTTTYL
ncbi:helix-turn-helix domain-containing protein [Paenibacillus phytorum]|uniref:helix-turn-helix domain-containing protein n=1 Tax=Paenibacillus phytorum TaxID=2654977 RepID=UPI001491B882